jgi:DNA repair exonuclease SbcCD ATPase subunit
MDVKLQNTYVQVLLDNFISVVKQNILFQAQMEVTKSETNEANDIKRKIAELSTRNEELQKVVSAKDQLLSEKERAIVTLNSEKSALLNNSAAERERALTNLSSEKDRMINSLTVERDNLVKDIQQKENQISSMSNFGQEKTRLQQAVNDYMRQLNETKSEVLKIKSESQDVLIRNNTRIDELTKYISKLEAIVPASKLKKVKLGEEVSQTETPDDGVRSGGTF